MGNLLWRLAWWVTFGVVRRGDRITLTLMLASYGMALFFVLLLHFTMNKGPA